MTIQLACTVQEELENLLDDSGHLRTLAFLYANKGMDSKALAIWRVLARNYSTGLWTIPLKDSIQSATGDVLSAQEIAASEASKILEQSSDQDLVLQHFSWVGGNIYSLICYSCLIVRLSSDLWFS